MPKAPVEQRSARHADEANAALLAGDRLLHTDLNPHNILTPEDSARIVDWAGPPSAPLSQTPPAPRCGRSPKATPDRRGNPGRHDPG
ncbi:hypothetical protein [Amycolatopsis sp. cmx-11-12]|uniref:hypothetical protein n=1 Tax=Amycolatopsis sp. cmx-11-12 TaxID=2785795 RepID=UPI00391831C2